MALSDLLSQHLRDEEHPEGADDGRPGRQVQHVAGRRAEHDRHTLHVSAHDRGIAGMVAGRGVELLIRLLMLFIHYY